VKFSTITLWLDIKTKSLFVSCDDPFSTMYNTNPLLGSITFKITLFFPRDNFSADKCFTNHQLFQFSVSSHSRCFFYFEDQIIPFVNDIPKQKNLVVVMAVVCCVTHSFQSHQLLHTYLLLVNKLCRQTALPCEHHVP